MASFRPTPNVYRQTYTKRCKQQFAAVCSGLPRGLPGKGCRPPGPPKAPAARAENAFGGVRGP
eukprot:15043718-Alexandrium_andersonii.AAC.1